MAGVRLADGREVRARLTIAADGRSSIVAEHCRSRTWARRWTCSGSGSPRRQHEGGPARQCRARTTAGDDRPRRLLAVRLPHPQGRGRDVSGARDRGDPRGGAAAAPPDLDLAELDEISDLHLLTVKLDRLTCWQRPGLLAIGDAAHAMSPIGGIGINLAIQDAVAAANILAGPLARGDDVDPLLHKVQDRRLFPTRSSRPRRSCAGPDHRPPAPARRRSRKAPLIVRLLDRFPLLRRIPGRFIGLGVRRERVRSPAAPSPP